jgi:hypothetical protein
MSADAPWWALLPPAEAEVSCGEQTHRLVWREGRLTATDHPDAEGELVLAALGGERSDCMDLIESWGSRGDDLEVLAVGPRSPADELTITPDDIEIMRTGGGLFAFTTSRLAARSRPLAALRPRPGMPWPHPLSRGAVSYGGFLSGTARGRAAVARQHVSAVLSHSAGRGGVIRGGTARRIRRGLAHDGTDRAAARRAELLSLLALGAEFQFRLSATVAAAWADAGSRAGDRRAGQPALVAALTGRLAPAAQSWLGIDPAQVEVALHEDEGWGRLALAGTGDGRTLRAALPAGWLASVWAAGLAVAGGHLIVEIKEAAWPEATVLGVPQPGADPVILKVRAEGGRWTAATAAGNGVHG